MNVAERRKVGVVGAGHVGRHHARVLGRTPEVELVAVVDTDRARADLVASETESRAEVEATRLLGEVDAVTVAVPTEFMRGWRPRFWMRAFRSSSRSRWRQRWRKRTR